MRLLGALRGKAFLIALPWRRQRGIAAPPTSNKRRYHRFWGWRRPHIGAHAWSPPLPPLNAPPMAAKDWRATRAFAGRWKKPASPTTSGWSHFRRWKSLRTCACIRSARFPPTRKATWHCSRPARSCSISPSGTRFYYQTTAMPGHARSRGCLRPSAPSSRRFLSWSRPSSRRATSPGLPSACRWSWTASAVGWINCLRGWAMPIGSMAHSARGTCWWCRCCSGW